MPHITPTIIVCAACIAALIVLVGAILLNHAIENRISENE